MNNPRPNDIDWENDVGNTLDAIQQIILQRLNTTKGLGGDERMDNALALAKQICQVIYTGVANGHLVIQTSPDWQPGLRDRVDPIGTIDIIPNDWCGTAEADY
jgi:hypothetical protein